MFRFSPISLRRLETVHPDLQRLAHAALRASPVDFMISEGVRDILTQRKLVSQGYSKTMNSRHLTGHAIDVAAIVAGKIAWDWAYYHQIAESFKQASRVLGIPVQWGGDWKTFPDGPHFELPRKDYPPKKGKRSS